MKENMTIQDAVLDECIRKVIPVSVYLTNGFMLRGILKAKDNFVVIIEADGKHQMVYKHAISTIAPLRPLSCINNQ